MKQAAIIILCFILGFFGGSLVIDTPEVIADKGIFMFFCVLVSTLLLIIDNIIKIKKK